MSDDDNNARIIYQNLMKLINNYTSKYTNTVDDRNKIEIIIYIIL